MKINGRIYNTATAAHIGGGLYKKTTGECFLAEGENIRPMTAEEAHSWAVSHLSPDVAKKVANPVEDPNRINTIYAIIQDAAENTDSDEFVSDWALSTALLPPEAEEVNPKTVETLRTVWDIVNGNISEIRAESGLTQKAFSEMLFIPLRTYQNWENENSGRKTPIYVKMLAAEKIGLLDTDDLFS